MTFEKAPMMEPSDNRGAGWLTLPKICFHWDLADALARFEHNQPNVSSLSIEIPNNPHVPPPGLALLGSWCLFQNRCLNRKITFVGDRAGKRYLSRMNLLRLAGSGAKEDFQRHAEAGRFVALETIACTKDCNRVINLLGDVVLHQFDNAREFFPALEWAVNEVMDNIHIHAESPVPGVVCAQYYSKQHRVEVGICDMGRGILASLGHRYQELNSDEVALRHALQRGVTRDPEIGQGNGLAGTRDIALANRGTFHIWSGDTCLRLKGGQAISPIPFAYRRGTGIWLSLDTLKPVDLSKTFIGEQQADPNESIILNNIETVACTEGLRVVEECDHVGARPPATGLRRKIEAILANGPNAPIIVDFATVTGASSSFLDELLGRLFVSLGEAGFNTRIKLVNLSDEMKRRAEVVINQRSTST